MYDRHAGLSLSNLTAILSSAGGYPELVAEGVLVLAAELDSQKLIAAGSSLERVRNVVRETLDPMTRLLRTLSQIAISNAR